MGQQENKPATVDMLRAMAPGWFIFAGIAAGFLLGLKGMQFSAAAIFGVFLTDLTYAIFFDQTLGVLLNTPVPRLRYMMLASAAIMLLVFWMLWSNQ